LDSYGGTLVVISHDRYFLERVCDRFVGLLGDKKVRDLPRGVDEYLEQRAEAINSVATVTKEKKTSNAAEERQWKKDLTRLDRQLEKSRTAIATLIAEQETAAFDANRLTEIAAELVVLTADAAKLEEEWLKVTLLLEG
jgi:ATP-binding cassette subfamily F protein uup